MPDINDIMADALSAHPVQDDEQKEQYVDTALEFVQSRDSFAVESVTVDTIEGEAMEMTTVWNEDVKRTEVTGQPMGSTEIIIPDNSEYVFVGTEMPPMMGGLAGGQSESEQVYMCLNDEGLSDLTNQSTPDERDDKVELLRVIRNGQVSIDGDTVFFELNASTDDLHWMDPSTYKEDVDSEGIHAVVTFDLSEERLGCWLETIRNSEEPNSYSLKEFIYNESFDFRVPDKDDEDVVEFDGSGLGGLGSGGIGGGLDEIVGDSAGSLDDLMGNLTQGSGDLFEDDSIF